jgi:hypothetical protein
MRLRSRVDRAERQLPAPPALTPRDRQLARRRRAVAQRFTELVCGATALMTESDGRRVNEALESFQNATRGPLDRWLDDLHAGRCRLPALTPVAMKELLLAWLHPLVGQPMVCNQCGLEYPRLRRPGSPVASRQLDPPPLDSAFPYQVARLFDVCPSCGASRYDTSWPTCTSGKDLPWKALDGWVGEQQ